MAEKTQVSRHSVGFFVLVRSLSCAYSYENVTIIKRSLLKSVFIIGAGAPCDGKIQPPIYLIFEIKDFYDKYEYTLRRHLG